VNRLGPALLALPLAWLAGCPIDQPLPVLSGVRSSPRIVFEEVSPKGTIIDVSKVCSSTPQFTLQAILVDENLVEAVEARWFVDYQVPGNVGLADTSEPAPSPSGSDATRRVRDFIWSPLDYGTFLSPVHVVELVVSNGFWPLNHPGDPLPNRTPQTDRETQVFRWVFRYVDPPGGQCQ
jgi:hypothetical protein